MQHGMRIVRPVQYVRLLSAMPAISIAILIL